MNRNQPHPHRRKRSRDPRPGWSRRHGRDLSRSLRLRLPVLDGSFRVGANRTGAYAVNSFPMGRFARDLTWIAALVGVSAILVWSLRFRRWR